MSTRKILCIDFDGVIHDYREGWQGGIIYGKMTSGFLEWAAPLQDEFRLVVYSSRSKDPMLLAAMKQWLDDCMDEQDIHVHFTLTSEKPPAWLTIDDRAVRFDGDWSAPELSRQALIDYRPWMHR